MSELENWLEPMDAANRRAHFERGKNHNAFHDGAMTPEIMALIEKKRDEILARIKSTARPKAESSNAPGERPPGQPKG